MNFFSKTIKWDQRAGCQKEIKLLWDSIFDMNILVVNYNPVKIGGLDCIF